MRSILRGIAAAALLLLAAHQAGAQEKLRVGKAIQNSFTFGLIDVGIANGVFKKNGFAVEPVTFSGAAKLQQALTSNDIDIGISTGQDMGFILKGLPAMTIAAVTNAPRESVMLVGYDSPIKAVADLKGKKVAVSNIRGYPSWLTIELSKHEGWGRDGMTLITTGSQPASMALLKTKQVDAWAGDIGSGIDLEDTHEARILLDFSDYVPPFMNTAMYATNTLIKSRPETVRRFVKAWFENVAWARDHRQETVALLVPVLNSKPSTVDRVYEKLMPTQSLDGKFDPAAMATMRRAVVELGILDKEPDLSKLYTEEFLPKS
jgi:ABC-type nitrate/sulfonate/bicarbonate transport system substrate-binding protein